MNPSYPSSRPKHFLPLLLAATLAAALLLGGVTLASAQNKDKDQKKQKAVEKKKKADEQQGKAKDESQSRGDTSRPLTEAERENLFGKDSTSPAKPASAGDEGGGQAGAAVILGVGALLLAVFVFYSYCAKRICRNCGHEPGWLIWIPILQLVPQLAAAKLPGWMVILFLIPFVNVIALVFLFWKLCLALGKPGSVSLLMLVPGINAVLPIYLAFAAPSQANGSAPEQGTSSPGGDSGGITPA